jgi:hypothetical protein
MGLPILLAFLAVSAAWMPVQRFIYFVLFFFSSLLNIS